MGDSNQYTVGPWETEDETAAAFDAAVAGDPRFQSIYREVRGIYTARSPYDHDQTPRIDRVLVPSKLLRDARWIHGAIGVEIKKPGTKIGHPLAQAMDYARASFEVMPGFHMPLAMVFLFPTHIIGGDLEAVTVQNRVGTCNLHPLGELVFFRGASRIMSIDEPQRNHVPFKKVGSR